jgi:glutamate 5-kinase
VTAPATPEAIDSARRIVVKVGSSSISGERAAQIAPLVDALAAAHARGAEIVLVSSGAIATGMPYLRLHERPTDLAVQQAAAAVGQSLLIKRYQEHLDAFGITAAQVLLTASDIDNPTHRKNAERAIETLLALRILPIVNENDTVATHEIRFGDNDRLAALVAHLVQADALVLLSDVDGLYTGRPGSAGARFIAEVESMGELAGIDVSRSGSHVGSGGMTTKLDAAAIATSEGVPVLLASASQAAAALLGEVGTAFAASGDRSASRLFWLRHATTPRGRLVLDSGAVAAVVQRRMSLLPAGVTSVHGEFYSGEPVDLVDGSGAAVARGLVGYDAAELPPLLGRRTTDLPAEFRREIVHRDDLVVL